MLDSFEFLSPTRLIFEEGCHRRAGEIVAPLGGRVLVVSGRSSMRRLGFLDAVAESCANAGCDVTLFEGVEENPSCVTVDKGVKVAVMHGCNVVLALGGGSTMETL